MRVNLLFRSFLTRNRSVLVKAYVTYVRPFLEYNLVVWSPYKIVLIRVDVSVPSGAFLSLAGILLFLFVLLMLSTSVLK